MLSVTSNPDETWCSAKTWDTFSHDPHEAAYKARGLWGPPVLLQEQHMRRLINDRTILDSSTSPLRDPEQLRSQQEAWQERKFLSGVIQIVAKSYTTNDTSQLTRVGFSVEELIQAIRESEKLTYGSRLASRLRHLVEIAEEEYPEQSSLSPKSLSDFVVFLIPHSSLRYPSVVLTPDGNIRARWKNGGNRQFSVEFLGDEDIRFVLISPDPKKTYKIIRITGLATTESLMDVVAPYNIISWATNIRKAA